MVVASNKAPDYCLVVAWVGTPRVLSEAYLNLIQWHDTLWEYMNDMAADLAGYLARRMNAARLPLPPIPTSVRTSPVFFARLVLTSGERAGDLMKLAEELERG